MTSKERLLALVSGKGIDHKPLILWPHSEMNSDVAIVSLKRLANAKTSQRAVLAEILSPFSRSLKTGLNLSKTLQRDPKEGEKVYQALVEEVRTEINLALEQGVDGIFYRLQGAEPDFTTPMEYGGLYLETDRELLQLAMTAHLNVLFIEGGPELYMDFVSDLPAHIFAWDSHRTDIPLSAVKKMRIGALATGDPEADVLFGSNYGLLKQWVNPTLVETK
ncbi:MAG TPA: hypothetical protein VGL56_16745 [Fimbriimonadaceae bacterium]|jgi:hypothetical protein